MGIQEIVFDSGVKIIKSKVEPKLDSIIEELFYEMHSEYKTEFGDITPEQAFRLDELKEELSELIATQVYQNITRKCK